jgi:hypothetical protein
MQGRDVMNWAALPAIRLSALLVPIRFQADVLTMTPIDLERFRSLWAYPDLPRHTGRG